MGTSRRAEVILWVGYSLKNGSVSSLTTKVVVVAMMAGGFLTIVVKAGATAMEARSMLSRQSIFYQTVERCRTRSVPLLCETAR